jgi:uncharacterized membrane-anchored protein
MEDKGAARSTLGLREHPSRRALAGEVHARPYELLQTPLRVSHLAVLHEPGWDESDHRGDGERDHLNRLLLQHGAEPPGDGAIQVSRTLGALRLRYERHTEFSTYTVYRFDAFDDPFAATALELLPGDWLRSVPGEVIAAVHLAVEHDARPPDTLAALFGGNALVGNRVSDGGGEVWTDFRLHADGFSRILARNLTMTRGQVGRLVQRLLEIETYRLLALLAFPLARRATGETAALNIATADIIDSLADPVEAGNDRALLDRLTGLAAQAERLDSATAFRLSAARAYHSIVEQRIAELRGDRIPGFQTVTEFMERRLAPAMKTCETAAERQANLSQRIARTSGLLRTRVDIALEERNTALLKSMNRRARLQLRLQETVEALSVAAVSYYLVALVADAARGLQAAGLPIDSDIVALISLPIILGGVALGLHRLRRALAGGDGAEG